MGKLGELFSSIVKRFQSGKLTGDDLNLGQPDDLSCNSRLLTDSDEALLLLNPAVTYQCGPEPEYKVLYISPNIYRQLGYKPQDFYNDTYFWTKRIHPEDAEFVLGKLAHAKSAVTSQIEYRFQHSAGHYVWLLDEYQAIVDSQQKVVSLVGSWFNISEKKQMEEALRLSDEKFRTLVEYSSDAIFLMVGDHYELVNQRFRDLLGYDLDELNTLGFSFMQLIDPDRRKRFNQAWLPERIVEGPSVQFEFRGWGKGGRRVELEASLSCFNFHGQRWVQGILRDITERKKTREAEKALEARYRQMFTDNRAIKLLISPDDGRIIDANPAACGFYGYAPEKIRQMKITDINILPADEVKEEMEKARSQCKDFFEFKHRLADGRICDVEVHSSPIDIDGEIRLFSVVYDISDRKLAEAALRGSQEQLLEAQTIGRIGNWSYDIATNTVTWSNEIYRLFEFDVVTQPLTLEQAMSYFTPAARQQIQKNLADVLQKNITVTSDLEIALPSGQSRTLHVIVKPVKDENQQIVRLAGTFQDITERKLFEQELTESRRMLSSLLSNLPGMAYRCHFDREWTMEFVSDRCRQLTGYDSNELLYNQKLSFNDLIHAADREDVWLGVERAVKRHEPYILEYRIVTKEGETKWVWEQGAGVYDPAGQVLALEGLILDITEQKTAEVALLESENRYELATRSGHIGVWDWNLASGELYVDFNLIALLGYAPGEIGNRIDSWLNLIHPNDVSKLKQEFKSHLKDSASRFEVTHRMLHKDGSARWFILTGKVLRQTGKRPTRVLGTSFDITDRKKAEDALKKKESDYRQLFNKMIDAFALCEIICDEAGKPMDFRYLEVNPSFERVTGLSASLVVGNTAKTILPDTEDYWIKALGKVALSGEAVHFENYLGELGKYFEVTAFSPQPGQFATLFVDITEQRHSEQLVRKSQEMLQAIIDNTQAMVYVKDLKGRYLLINRRFERVNNLSSEKVINRTAKELFPIEYADKYIENDQKVLFTRCQQTFEEPVLVGGELHTFLSVKFPLLDAKGTPYAVCGIATDINERKKQQEELSKLEKLESVGILAGGIAHDFNNFLTGILGNISLAKEEISVESDMHKQLEEAEEATIRARDLTQQLLTFSRGGQPIKKAASIREIVRDNVSFILRGSKVGFKVNVAENLWGVEVDAGQMSQVFQNLAINAVQAMPEGGQISIELNNVEVIEDSSLPLRAGPYVKITVSDTGPGIPVNHRSRIFDPYFSTKKNGNGLGLATCYSIIKKHDGHITVESELGQGASFQIHLPASREISAASGQIVATATKGSGRVLVMDDEAFIRNLAEKILTKAGYEVVSVRDGLETIRVYGQALDMNNKFDVVILDLTIPGGMGGTETLERLIRLDSQVKAIVCSGYSNNPIMANYREFGFAGVVAKPYRPTELTKIVFEIVNKAKEPTKA